MRQINDTVTGEGFADVLSTLDWDATADRVAATGETDVRRVLAKAAAGRQLNIGFCHVLGKGISSGRIPL